MAHWRFFCGGRSSSVINPTDSPSDAWLSRRRFLRWAISTTELPVPLEEPGGSLDGPGVDDDGLWDEEEECVLLFDFATLRDLVEGLGSLAPGSLILTVYHYIH